MGVLLVWGKRGYCLQGGGWVGVQNDYGGLGLLGLGGNDPDVNVICSISIHTG